MTNTFFRLEFDNGGDWPKDFLAHDLHVRLDICEDRRLDEESFGPVPLSADLHFSAVCFPRVYVAHNTLNNHVGKLSVKMYKSPTSNWI